ncbi:M61 family metallopeptidase [Paradesertivirga mongoliensis]|uniref:M61 family metallopeptidase n=1 Tax=Paradesertivirga mongoliensis TaxID=2100740 RepID=A0ABW4ZJ92_9SPHI|nr:PDZ domain-containing protein [Pedobacter mongoliensis]
MKKLLSHTPIYILFMMLNAAGSAAQSEISYVVSFPEAQAHYADVEMNIKGINSSSIDLRMPVWAPGSYLVREFAKNVEGFSARTSSNTRLSSSKINKNTWRISGISNKDITINYRIYAFELSVRTSFVDVSHAFLSPSGLFMYPDGQISSPSTVTIKPYQDWKKISTGLEPVKGQANTFYAPNYDILYDSPLEVGNHDTFEFEAAGVKHEVAMYGGGNYDKKQLSADITKIVEAETDIFDGNPNKRYVFIVHNTLAGGGGLEHLNSTVLGAIRLGYTNEDSYKSFLGLVAHEYFHLWNVKRLRPQALGPFDYSNENYTTNLWVAEGFTAYYDNLMLRRTNIYSPEKYLELLTTDINTVENQPGNRIQPVSEASFDAWIKYYRPNENSKNSTISYYDKGAMIGLILDLEILGATKGARRLDDVMKAMYDEYYKKLNRGYTDAEFKAMAEKIAGKPLDEIYTKYINGTEPISFNSYLGHAGLYLVNDHAGKSIPTLGAATVVRDGKLMITSVQRGTAAWTNGLSVNDEIIAIDDYRITGTTDTKGVTDLAKAISAKKVRNKIKVTVSRDGIIRNIDVTLTQHPGARYRIEGDKNATAQQMAIRKKWLSL